MRAAKFIHLALILIGGFATIVGVARAQSIVQVCNPTITANRVVATAAQRKAAGEIAQPPLTDQANGFAWPDSPLGVIKTEAGYTFFGSDGAFHSGNFGRDTITATISMD